MEHVYLHWFYNSVHSDYGDGYNYFVDSVSVLQEDDREYLIDGMNNGFISVHVEAHCDIYNCVRYLEYDPEEHGLLDEDNEIIIYLKVHKLETWMSTYLTPDVYADHTKVLKQRRKDRCYLRRCTRAVSR